MPKLTLVCKGRDRFISLITPFKMIKKHCLLITIAVVVF